MGFSTNWKALGMVVVVLFPYFTVMVRGSEGTFSARYSPVLQEISAPKSSLPRQHVDALGTRWKAERLDDGGRRGGPHVTVAWSHKVTVQWKATWQQPDSLLKPGFAFSVACYFSVTSA